MHAILLFPGQGSQTVGMGKALYQRFPAVRQLFALADEILGFSITQLCFEGPIEKLTLTANAQPALLLVSMAALQVLKTEHGLSPVAAAGHSLGEFSALVAAGSLQFEDALRLVRERGLAMQEAVPPGQGSMVAIFGLQFAEVEQLCGELARGEVVSPANDNGAGQVVIAGHKGAVDRVAQAARQAGAKRVVPLPVSAPFHCSLMAPAAKRLAKTLSTIPLQAPQLPVISNVTGLPYPDDAEEIRQLLIEQVTHPVRWQDCLRTLANYGCSTALEVGPGRVLTNLAKRTFPTWTSIATDELLSFPDSSEV